MLFEGLRYLMRVRHRVSDSFDLSPPSTNKDWLRQEKLHRRYDYDDLSADEDVKLTALRKIPTHDSRAPLSSNGCAPLLTKKLIEREAINNESRRIYECTETHHSEHLIDARGDEERHRFALDEYIEGIGDHYDLAQLRTAFQAASRGDTTTLSACIISQGIPADVESSQGVSLLQLAIQRDHVKAVKMLVELGASLNKATSRGRTPLLTAAKYGAIQSMKLILQLLCEQEKSRLKKSNNRSICSENAYDFLFALDENKDSALHLACRGLEYRCVKALLCAVISKVDWREAEKILGEANERGYAPIHVACMWRSVAVVRLLLSSECNKAIAKACPIGRTSRIANALRNASINALKWQLQTGSILHEMAYSKACSGCACERIDQHQMGIGSNVGYVEGLPIGVVAEYEEDDLDLPSRKCIQCEKKAKEIVKMLAKRCPQLLVTRSISGLTPLMSAVAKDALGIVEALLQLKVDTEEMDGKGRTAMHHAASRGISRQVAILLSWGASPCRPDFECNRPMHYAAIKGHTASLRLLYRANKYIDVATPSGHTAFMWAAMFGCDASLRTMLNENPLLSRHERDNEGNTALHLAAKRDLPDTVKLLVSAGWDTECKNDRGESAFVTAAANGSANAMRALLSYGADVFALDKDDNSALHVASRSDDCRDALRELLAWLVESRFINFRNNDGKTPLHIAAENCAVKCIRELLKNGADIRVRDSRGWDCLMLTLKANPRSWPILTILIKHSPNMNGYSPIDNVSTLSLAQTAGNELFVAYLKMHGAMLPFEIIDRAARRIQRWYRKKLFLRGLLHQPNRKGARIRQVCASLGAEMLEAGAQIPSVYFAVRRSLFA
uniref:Uncharacterized protein n=1 Tax=Parascaris univalens TaxID=6257 RepID=A0A915BNU5_PARUN